MRASAVVIMYLIMGVVMFGGGAITWSDIGMAQHFVEMEGDGEVVTGDDQAEEDLSGVGGAIKGVIDQFVGGLLIVWSLISGLISFMHWPLLVLRDAEAPPIAQLLLGAPLVAAFYMSLVRMIRSSA